MRVTCVVEVPLIVTFVCQPNSWLCGPFALKHGLLLSGLRADEEEIARIAGTDHTGTDETELARAAGHFGCSLGSVRRRDAEAAKRDLTRLLADTTPVLLCIEQWDHWVAAAHEEEGTFVVLDSRAPAIFRVLPWEYLRELLVYRRGRHTRIYDLHPLEACGDRALRPVFTVSRAQFLQQWENRPIAQGWYGYLRDALAVNVNGTLHLLEFARRSRKAALLHVSTCYVAGEREVPLELGFRLLLPTAASPAGTALANSAGPRFEMKY